MTAALEGGEWSAVCPGCTLPPGTNRYPFYRKLGGPQGQSGQAENLIPTGIRSRTVQPIVSHYTNWATRPTTEMGNRNISWWGGSRGVQCVGLTNLQPSCADCLEIWEPQLPGILRVCPGLQWDCSTFNYRHNTVPNIKTIHALSSTNTDMQHSFSMLLPAETILAPTPCPTTSLYMP